MKGWRDGRWGGTLSMRMRDRIFSFPMGDAVWKAYCFVLKSVAVAWRVLLMRTTFVAVTGSVGKTTAKECVAAVLARRYRTAKTWGTANGRHGRARSLLRVKPWHRFAVIEVGIERPGTMRRAGRLVRPHAAVVMRVAETHRQGFVSLDATAEEKAKILDALPADGIAVLNAADPRVAAMADGRTLETIRFGVTPDCDVWADDVASRWPERLSFRLHARGTSRRVQTRLVGEHWVSSVLAGVAVGLRFGVSLDEAVAAAEAVEPSPGRMDPVELPNGATIVRDEYNGSIATFLPALEWLRQARAGRRIAVLGDWSDVRQTTRRRMRMLGQRAAECADLVVFVGPGRRHGRNAALQHGMGEKDVYWFHELREAAAFLRSELRGDDLVLLKGRTSDHLSRVWLALVGEVGCWKEICPKRILCDHCPEVGTGRPTAWDWVFRTKHHW